MRQGVTEGMGTLRFWLFHCLPNPALADEIWSELAERQGHMMSGASITESTQLFNQDPISAVSPCSEVVNEMNRGLRLYEFAYVATGRKDPESRNL